MNAAPLSTRIDDRPRPDGPRTERASGGGFEQLWAALRDAPQRKPAERAEPPTTEPVLVDAASMSMAAVKINADRVTDALVAFKRDSWLTFTNAVAASIYSAEPAPRDTPAATAARNPPRGAAAGVLD